jgi:membrane-associated phospholipid phosphatase
VRTPWIAPIAVIVLLAAPAAGRAQDAPAAAPTQVNSAVDTQSQTSEQNPPAAAGEEATKPTRGFASALVHNLGDDLHHLPRLNTVYWLAAGGAGAASIHHWDNSINRRLVGSGWADAAFTPGHVIGSTYVILGTATATYIAGRHLKWPRLQHLGMDEIEATILAEGFSEGLKLAVRRDRPVQVDGNQSSTYSFPSGHATLTFAAATVLQQHLGYKAGLPTYLVASYVAASRLHDNRHFASDVVFGAALGVTIGRTVTWHGRNFYGGPMIVPGGAGIMFAKVNKPAHSPAS